jgi:hypothetical protein
MNFQVLVTMLVYGGFCFHDYSDFSLNLIQFYNGYFRFQCWRFYPNILTIGWILTFGNNKNYLILTLLFVLSTNVAYMCRSIMCCSGQDQIGPSLIPSHDFLMVKKIQVIHMSKKKNAISLIKKLLTIQLYKYTF